MKFRLKNESRILLVEVYFFIFALSAKNAASLLENCIHRALSMGGSKKFHAHPRGVGGGGSG